MTLVGCGATMAVGVFDPGFPTQVGGRHLPGPTSPDRDSSREIDKAPGIMLLTHPAAPPRQCNAVSRLAPPGKRLIADRLLPNHCWQTVSFGSHPRVTPVGRLGFSALITCSM